MDPFTGLPVVLLASDTTPSTMPISIGLGEASAIALELDQIELERPMTHQLMCALLQKAGVQVDAVEIHDVRDGTFYARIRLISPTGELLLQDGRPSDALALALRCGVEIRVAAHVLEHATRLALSASWEDEPPSGPGAGSSVPGPMSGPAAKPGAGSMPAPRQPHASTPPALDDGKPLCRSARRRDLSELSDEAFGKWKM